MVAMAARGRLDDAQQNCAIEPALWRKPHCRIQEPPSSVRALRATSPEVTHSGECRRVINTRQSVWPIVLCRD